jgi:hypothetical protein
MKKVFFLFVIFINSYFLFSQNIYYGYPSSSIELSKGDVIILNLPEHIDGRFKDSKELDDLIKLVNDNNNLFFRIEINIFWGSKEYSNDYSNILCNNLKKILNINCTSNNYEIISNGANKPLIKDENDKEKYIKMNTRMDIIIE